MMGRISRHRHDTVICHLCSWRYKTIKPFILRSTMKSLVVALLLVLLISMTNAFTVAPRITAIKAFASTTTSLNMVFGSKNLAAQKAAEKEKEEKYWQGEWVCKDCGYIYNRVSPSAYCAADAATVSEAS